MVDFAAPIGVARELNEAEQPLKSGRAGCAMGAVLNSITMVDILKVLCSAPYYEYLRAGPPFERLRQPRSGVSRSSSARKLSVVDFCKRLKSCLAEQEGDRVNLCGGQSSCDSGSAISNVVSVAKNDELNNPVTMGGKVKGVHERIW